MTEQIKGNYIVNHNGYNIHKQINNDGTTRLLFNGVCQDFKNDKDAMNSVDVFLSVARSILSEN